MKEEKENIWKVLAQVDVSGKTDKKQSLTYLSWAWAWEQVKSRYPSLSYEVVTHDGKPYLYDDYLGYLVQTNVTIDGETLPMHLPVMDGANKAMKNHAYTYKVKDWDETKKQKKDVFKDKEVDAATMFDINKAIMRCLVKNIALFGLGINLYLKEDLPLEYASAASIENYKNLLKVCGTLDELREVYMTMPKEIQKELKDYSKELSINLQ